jgi:cytosine/adenosine deaminase-related metal-dependent hydrolase
MDAGIVRAAAAAALAWLARTGCTTTMDHHYLFPERGGDVLAATIEAAAEVGLRFHPTRGSMDLGKSAGGLPPDDVVEEIDAILTATQAAIERFHDPSPGSMLRVGVAPCSPFSVSRELLTESAALARSYPPGSGVRLHTHLAETADENDYCLERFGCTPTEYVDSIGWLGPDVWLAHGVHLDDQAISRIAATGTGVAHCPSSNARLGAGICRTRSLLDAGVPVGLGVDGAASQEASSLVGEVSAAALFARAVGGAGAMTVREAVELGTVGGARVLGREADIGSLEPGKLADVALWRLDTLPHAGIDDSVAALVLGSPPPLELLLVGGRTVVERDRVVTVDEQQVADAARRASASLAG